MSEGGERLSDPPSFLYNQRTIKKKVVFMDIEYLRHPHHFSSEVLSQTP